MREDVVGIITQRSRSEAFYIFTVKQHIISLRRDIPHGIYTTREPCGNRKRVSVRRAIPGKRKRLRSFASKRGKFRILRMSVILASYNV